MPALAEQVFSIAAMDRLKPYVSAGHCSMTYFIGTSWSEGVGPQYYLAVAHELAARRHRVVVLVDHQRTDVEDHDGNPAVYTWPSYRPTRWRDAWFLYRLMRRYRPACVIGNFGSTNLLTVIGWLTGTRCRLAWYHTVTSAIDVDARTSQRRLALLRLRKRLVHWLATCVVANSRASERDLWHSGIPPAKTRVAYYGMADPRSAVTRITVIPKRQALVICVGRFDLCKGQDVLIRAMAILTRDMPDVRAEFLGEGPCRSRCEDLARAMGVNSRCSFQGAVNHRTVLERMATADVSVIPSNSEAFGVVNLESLAMGTPVVASRVGGISEIVRDGIDGFLVPAGDAQVLASKLGFLLSNPVLCEQMGQDARKGFLERFELSRQTSQLSNWLEEITAAADPSVGSDFKVPL